MEGTSGGGFFCLFVFFRNEHAVHPILKSFN